MCSARPSSAAICAPASRVEALGFSPAKKRGAQRLPLRWFTRSMSSSLPYGYASLARSVGSSPANPTGARILQPSRSSSQPQASTRQCCRVEKPATFPQSGTSIFLPVKTPGVFRCPAFKFQISHFRFRFLPPRKECQSNSAVFTLNSLKTKDRHTRQVSTFRDVLESGFRFPVFESRIGLTNSPSRPWSNRA